MKKDKRLLLIFLLVLVVLIFNFFLDRTARLKDFIRYPNPKIWSLSRAPRFEDFPINETFKEKPAAVDISSNSGAREFRGALRYTAEDGPNFAGHYAVAEWGCGSTCQDGMIINIATGKVYDPFKEATARGVNYKLKSNLFITDPYSDDTPLIEEILRIPVKYYIWKDNKLLQIYQEECSPVDENKYLCK